MKKYKKCKGINKANDSDGCGEMIVSQMRKYGLCQKCYGKWLYTSEKGKEMLSNAISIVQKPRIELEKYKNEKKENKSLSYLLVNVRNICHEYVKERDRGKDCIACGVNWRDDFHSSHFYKAELYSSLKFDETNIHSGCQKCNLYLDGNEGGFRLGLIKRYSKGYVDLLDSKGLLERKQGFKWDRIALEEIRDYYKQKLKELKDAKKN